MTEEYDDISKQIKTTDFSIAYKPPEKQIEFIDNLSAWENDEDIQEKGAIYLDYLAKNTTGWKKFLDAGSWGTNDDIIETLRDESFRLGTKAARATQLEEAPEEVKESYKYLKKRYDTSSLGNSEQWYKAAAEISTDIIADPINLVGLLMSGGGAAIGASMAGKSAITQVLKRLAVGESTKTSVVSTALAGSAWSGLDNYADQQVELAVGLRDQFNNSELGTSLAFGAVVGGVLGLGAGKLRKAQVARAADETEASSRAVADIDVETFEIASGFKDDVLEKIENKMFIEGDFENIVEEVVEKHASKVGGGKATKDGLRQMVLETIAESQGPTGEKVASNLGLKAKQFFHGYIPKATLVGKPAGILSAYSKFSKTAGVLQKKFRYDLGLGIKAERKIVAPDFFEQIKDIQGERWMDIKVALEPIVLNAKNKVADDANDEIISILRGGVESENKAINGAATKIRKVLNDIGRDLKEAGLIDESLEDYFPRMWDRNAIENNQDAFKTLLMKKQGANGELDALAKDADEADAIIESLLDIQNQVGLGGSSKSFFSKRKFNIANDDMFKDFIDGDLNNVLLSYVTQTSKQIAKVKVFGVRDINEFTKVWLNPLVDEMKEAGRILSKNERTEILDIYRSATSEGLPRNSEAVEGALDWYILGTRMALLPLATLSSVTEVVTNLAKAGTVNAVKGLAQATNTSFKQLSYNLVNKLKKDSGLTDPEAFKELNRHWLAMEQSVADSAERLSGDELSGKWTRKINAKFFRLTFLDQWTKFVQLASFNSGKELIKDNLQRLAADQAFMKASRSTDSSTRSVSNALTDELVELGVDVEKGLAWLARGAKKEDDFYMDVQKGAARYTNEIILQPTAAAGIKPRFMSNPRTIIFIQLLSYPAAYTNTILKNAAVKLIRDPKRNAPRTLAAALIMTEMARVGNYYRSHGESEKNKTPTEARLAAIARWGGYTLVLDIMERSRKSAEIYQSNVAYIAGLSPLTSDIYKLVNSGDFVSFLGSKMPGYAAFKTLGGEDFKNDYDTLTKELNKKLTKFLVPEKEKKISFATGGEVNIPNAPKEPDQRIDKMTGLPYDVQAGDAFIDNEDPLRRLGFKGGGFVTDPLKRLGFGVAGNTGMVEYAKGGIVEQEGKGLLFKRANTPAPMDPILEHHYRNLAEGKAVNNKDGSVSTVYTAQVDIDGTPTLIPKIWDGKVLSDEAAIQRSLASGKTWPTAATHKDLRQYDIELHKEMAPMTAEAAQKVLADNDALQQYALGGKVAKKTINYLDDSLTNIITKYSKKEVDPREAEKAADEILEPFRGYGDMPGELDDQDFVDFIKSTVKAQLEEKHDMTQEEMKAKMPQFFDAKGNLQGGQEFSKARGYTADEVETFEVSSELSDLFDNAQDVTALINESLSSIKAIDVKEAKDTEKALKDLFVQKEKSVNPQEPMPKIEEKYSTEISNLNPEEVKILKALEKEIPEVTKRPVKQRDVDVQGRKEALQSFLADSQYKKPVYRATSSGFDTDYEISFVMPREIGTHVGSRGQASSMAIRSVQSPDSMSQKLTTEKEIAEQFAAPQKQERPLAMTSGYINVVKPLEFTEDLGNWGAYSILSTEKSVNLFIDKISKQAFDGEGVSKDSVKARLNGLKKELDVLIKTKQDKGESSFNYQVREADLNIKFKKLLENFGFDSIKYKNENEAVLKGEDPYSFILFNPTQFKSTYATRFDVGDPRQNFAEGGLLKKTIRKLNNV
jgi:hypothetical protein